MSRQGPSPPTRGSPDAVCELNRLWGSIPAYAGKPARVALALQADGVHPRLRGEASRH